jgi:hypothetical protein
MLVASSRLNEEKVVKPPMMPTARKSRAVGPIVPPAASAKMRPIRNDPTRFTRKVGQGQTWMPKRSTTATAVPQRATEPIAPPRATRKRLVQFIRGRGLSLHGRHPVLSSEVERTARPFLSCSGARRARSPDE